jgi:hypothetical protein
VRITFPAGVGAPTNAGGIAVSGGGAGGQGGATAGTAGSAGSQPGGGGGGGNSSGSSVSGGAGGDGQITVTPYASQPFKSLIVHRPPLGALKMFQPLVSVGGGNDVPNGATQYTMPQPVAGVNASFGGTYTLYLVAASLAGGSRTVTVTVNQFEFNGGPSYSVSTTPVTVTSSQVSNGLICAGVLTLPIKGVAADNTSGYYTVSVTSNNTADRYYDLIFLDTMGQTVIVNEPSGNGYITYYIDAPDPDRSLGLVLGSWNGRASAVSVMDACQAISGGPLAVEPADGDNALFTYCADGLAPAIGVSFWPSYFYDRYQ